MISSDEPQAKDLLAIDEITFAIPAQSFDISCSISAEEALPVVTEFALRITYVCGSVSPAQLQSFFGYSEKETSAVIKALLDERLIQWHDEQLELTPYAEARFQDSSDELPRFFKIQDWSAEVVFDLISFSPAERPSRLSRVRSLIELTPQDPDKQSKTIQWAERSFQENFREICKKDRAEIYKISDVDAGERFNIPLPCIFHVNFDGPTSIQRDIDDESFGDRLEIAEAISDAMAGSDRRTNDNLENFIAIFDDDVLKKYISNETFDLRRYVQDVHLTKAHNYLHGKVTPLLGSLYLKRNAAILQDWLRVWAVEESTSQDERQETLSALWLAPQSRLWARTRAAKELLQTINRALVPKSVGDLNAPARGVRTVLQIDRVDHHIATKTYRDTFPKLVASSQVLMGGNLELFLLPHRFMCALFHFRLEHHPVTVPFGFISSHGPHLDAATHLISRHILERGNMILLHGGQEGEPFDQVKEFSFLQPRGSEMLGEVSTLPNKPTSP
jgi:hypothetical protein